MNLDFVSMMEVVKRYERLDECEQEALNKILEYGVNKCELSILVEARIAVGRLMALGANNYPSDRVLESFQSVRRILKLQIDVLNELQS